MRITYKGDYALKSILELSLNYGRNAVTIHEMAERLDIPVKFLEQVLLELKRGGFVESKRGKVGGYFLAKPPSQIKLGDVIRFIDGQIEPIACVDIRYKGCNDTYKCVFRKIWREVAKKTSEIIDNISFEDLVKEIKSDVLFYAI
ncbi:MAG: Rrf2 family transcriptional regulator [Candidatus Omnitrophica bacterium]|nr:Rrf2 family transcriptional regulator [Candidatus Omnitrophota bacterium]MCM8826978.1 Rrf2 family transcriptional regulator [Candidatus Omnitrophota bacterium]